MPRPLALALVLTPLAACAMSRDIELTPELEAVVDGNNAFAVDLYGAAGAEEGNLFLSPFSIYDALGMTLAGASGTTRDELRDVLYVGDDEDAFHASLGALGQDLDGRFKGYELAVGNRLFGQAGLNWERDFLDLTADDYGAELEEEDFVGDVEEARADINAWVSDETRGNIPELLEAGDLSAATRLVLANAIWFKGDWAEAFEEDATADHDFTTAAGDVRSVKMMNGTLPARFTGLEGLSVLVLPYRGEEISMFAVLPDAADGLPALEESLDVDTLIGWLDDATGADVEITFPRLELRQRAELASLLSDLGMPTAFTPEAEFDRMLGDERLQVDGVIHEAWVRVDEEGTEAAAATAVTMEYATESIEVRPVFVADHPFLFGIRDELTGAILFLGRVADPS